MTDFDGDNHAHEPSAAELAEMDRGEARMIAAADGPINYVVLVACKDSTSHINNGEGMTWAEVYKSIGDQLEKWIDQDGLNVLNVTISATRDVVYQKRTGPV